MDAAFKLLDWATNPILFFSGGKDALATLLFLRAYWDRLTVAWVNPGAPHTETVAYMKSIAAMVPNFVELTGNQPTWIQMHGWPADVVPVRATSAGQLGAGTDGLKFQPYTACCWYNMGRPMLEFAKQQESNMIIMGQRRDEALRNRMRDEVLQCIDGVHYFQPINEWSTDDVLTFIESQGEVLPPFYEHGAQSSADCWNCTAYLDHNSARLNYMRREQPDLYAPISVVLEAMAARLSQETAPLIKILGA